LGQLGSLKKVPRINEGFSLASRSGNALALSLQSRGLKTKNLLKQAWLRQAGFFVSKHCPAINYTRCCKQFE